MILGNYLRNGAAEIYKQRHLKWIKGFCVFNFYNLSLHST